MSDQTAVADVADEELDPVSDTPVEASSFESAADSTAAEPVVSEAPASASPSLLERISKAGITLDATDDEAAFGQLVERMRQSDEAVRLAQAYEQSWPAVAQRLRRLEELEQRDYLAAQPKPPEPVKPWNPPVPPEGWQHYVENGQVRDDAPLAIKQGVAEYQAYRRNFVEKLTTDPEEALAPFITAAAQRLVDERLGASLGQIEGRAKVQAYLDQNADWIYEKDPATGQVIRDPLTNQGRVSPYGQRFGQLLQNFAGLGQDGAIRQAEYVLSLEAQAQQGRQATQQATAQQTAQQQRQQVIQQAARRNPSRAGSLPKTDDAPVQNGLSSLRDMIRQEFDAAGYDPSTELL